MHQCLESCMSMGSAMRLVSITNMLVNIHHLQSPCLQYKMQGHLWGSCTAASRNPYPWYPLHTQHPFFAMLRPEHVVHAAPMHSAPDRATTEEEGRRPATKGKKPSRTRYVFLYGWGRGRSVCGRMMRQQKAGGDVGVASACRAGRVGEYLCACVGVLCGCGCVPGASPAQAPSAART